MRRPVTATTPEGGHKHYSYWYAALAWLFTIGWALAFVWSWFSYESWQTWAKVAVTTALALTTPAGSDLLLLVGLRRLRR
jgi:hypothetical protein